MENNSDVQLVGAVLRGAREEFAQLVRRHEAVVWATARAILRDAHAAQDVTQAAFVTAYRKLATLRDGAAFGPWVLRIARHEALRAARQKREHLPLEAAALVDGGPDSGEIADSDEQALLAATAVLPEHERVVVALHYFQELSLAEVARVLNRPLGTVTKQLSRAHARLRKQLKQLNPE